MQDPDFKWTHIHDDEGPTHSNFSCRESCFLIKRSLPSFLDQTMRGASLACECLLLLLEIWWLYRSALIRVIVIASEIQFPWTRSDFDAS